MDDRTARAKMLAQGPIVNAAERVSPSCRRHRDDFRSPEPKNFSASRRNLRPKAMPERRSNVALMRLPTEKPTLFRLCKNLLGCVTIF
jgi:hypothetical protein